MEKLLIYLLARLLKTRSENRAANVELALYTSKEIWKAMERMDRR
jgi:hypothetical protein